MDVIEALLDRGAEVNLPSDVSVFQVHCGSNMVVRFVGKFVCNLCNLCGLCGMCISHNSCHICNLTPNSCRMSLVKQPYMQPVARGM